MKQRNATLPWPAMRFAPVIISIAWLIVPLTAYPGPLGHWASLIPTPVVVKPDNPRDTSANRRYYASIRLAADTHLSVTNSGPVVPRAAIDYGALEAVDGTATPECPHSSGAAFHPSGRYIYFTGGVGSPGRLCGYFVDPVTLAFTPIVGSPAATGSVPNAVAFEPSGSFMYVVGGASNDVSGYAIDSTTGRPVPVAGSPFATNGTTPTAIVVDHAGRFVYVANYRGNGSSPGTFTGSVSVFAVDRTTGALSHIAGSPFEMDRTFNDSATSLALTPDGRFLFVGGNGLTTFALDPGNGAITRIAERGDVRPGGLAVDLTGRFLYVPDAFSYVVHGFAIASDGVLTPIGTQPIGTPDPTSVTRGIVILGDLLYVNNTPANSIYAFRIQQATGALAAVLGSPFATDSRSFVLNGQGFLASGKQVESGDSVVAALGAFGGRPPYTWSITSGGLPPGLALNTKTGVIAGTAGANGSYTFIAQVADSTNATVSVAKTIHVGGPLYSSIPVVEFYNSSLDHYFVTWVVGEIAKLDAGVVIKGWTRTGKRFRSYAAPLPGTSPVCRYYIPPALGDSHYFGRGTTECEDTGHQHPTFVLEDANFMHIILPIAGVCPENTLPVYRVFSNRPDANHRYTIERTVRDAMVVKGWLAEGDGPDLVVMCAPA